MGYKQENDYRLFIAHLKILSIRAQNNNEDAKRYMDICKLLNQIKEKRHLALIGEDTKEKKIYKQITQLINEVYDKSDKSVENIIIQINNNIEYKVKDKKNAKEKEESER